MKIKIDMKEIKKTAEILKQVKQKMPKEVVQEERKKENPIKKYIDDKRVLLYINHYDYREIDNLLKEAVFSFSNYKIAEYRSFGEVDFEKKSIKERNIGLERFLENNSDEIDREKQVFLLIKDADEELKKATVQAWIKKIAETAIYHKNYNVIIIIVSQEAEIPEGIKKWTVNITLPKLSKNEIKKYILEKADEREIEITDEKIEELALYLKGLSKFQITQLLNSMTDFTINEYTKNKVLFEKTEMIKNSSVLEIIQENITLSRMGGLYNLREWLLNKKKIIENIEEAESFGLSAPKGVLLVGMPGCGKSMAAKIAASEFSMPLVRLDIGKLLGKYVGESEKNMQTALKTAEAISPCVLWIDEIEKAFAGINQSDGSSDTIKRLFGQFLTWLQEKKEMIFVVATANNINLFPPEFLRKGRFDEIFFIDFPNKEEREEIFKIHLEKMKQYNEDQIDLEMLSEKTERFSGADIEEAVKTAVEECFLREEREIDTQDLENSIEKITPIKEVMETQINSLKEQYKKYKFKSASMEMGKQKMIEKINARWLNAEKESENMVFVEGGTIVPDFFPRERKVMDLMVCKYDVTQKEWKKFMGKEVDYTEAHNEEYYIGENFPVNYITRYEALEYCNKVSEYYGLMPVYNLENGAIIYLDGTEAYPGEADFRKTEGYRLPTELEWIWFASGGKIAKDKGIFGKKSLGGENLDEIANIYDAWNDKMINVGSKKPNILGLYDIIGNCGEMVYDAAEVPYGEKYFLPVETPYFRNGYGMRVMDVADERDFIHRGEFYVRSALYGQHGKESKDIKIGFRIVRTADPKLKHSRKRIKKEKIRIED